MKTLQYSIQIGATPERVWECLWEPGHYRQWTGVFCEGSYYETERFSEGSRIRLLTPGGEGMYSVLERVDEPRFLAFRHLGWISGFRDVPPAENEEPWQEARETYSLATDGEATVLVVQVDTLDEYIGHMEAKFPPALEVVKRMAESKL